VQTLAVGILYVLLRSVLAQKASRKRLKVIKADLATAFREPAVANTPKKSKAYRDSDLCIQIARHPEILSKVIKVASREHCVTQ
jgi:hypothetical protein